MSGTPETYVGKELRGVFAPRSGVASAGQTTVVYELVRFVGAGKFAWVYEARPSHKDAAAQRVAVKLLYRDDVQAVRRFQRETKVMRELPSHPNCVAYKGHGAVDKHPWVAMDFVDGFTLSAVLRGGRPIPSAPPGFFLEEALVEQVARDLGRHDPAHSARELVGPRPDLVDQPVSTDPCRDLADVLQLAPDSLPELGAE